MLQVMQQVRNSSHSSYAVCSIERSLSTKSDFRGWTTPAHENHSFFSGFGRQVCFEPVAQTATA